MKNFKNILTPARIIPLSFIVAILVGTILLLLPISSVSGGTDFLTALFTATTSVCVTGLVVVDTYSYWTLFGKIVILILIQIGGLGIVTFMAAVMLALKKKFSYSSQLVLQDAFNLNSLHGLFTFLRHVFTWTAVIEGIGALVYMLVFIPRFGFITGIAQSVFTAISAFCNAGIDCLGPDSLISYQTHPLIIFNTMFLIVTGGIGYVVLIDIRETIQAGRAKKFSAGVILRRLSEHTKLILAFTAFLLALGTVVVFGLEYSNPATIGNMSLGNKLLNSLFQSVTFRTAGFAAVPQEALRDPTVLFGCVLMFIGGSPVGTAGGVKTLVFATVLMNAHSYISSREEVVLFNRQINRELIRKANAIVIVAFSAMFIMLCALLTVESIPLVDGLYEIVSAIGTVGLSRSLTSSLHTAGRIIIIISMYLGRIGPISMALFFHSPSSEHRISHAEGKFIVG